MGNHSSKRRSKSEVLGGYPALSGAGLQGSGASSSPRPVQITPAGPPRRAMQTGYSGNGSPSAHMLGGGGNAAVLEAMRSAWGHTKRGARHKHSKREQSESRESSSGKRKVRKKVKKKKRRSSMSDDSTLQQERVLDISGSRRHHEHASPAKSERSRGSPLRGSPLRGSALDGIAGFSGMQRKMAFPDPDRDAQEAEEIGSESSTLSSSISSASSSTSSSSTSSSSALLVLNTSRNSRSGRGNTSGMQIPGSVLNTSKLSVNRNPSPASSSSASSSRHRSPSPNRSTRSILKSSSKQSPSSERPVAWSVENRAGNAISTSPQRAAGAGVGAGSMHVSPMNDLSEPFLRRLEEDKALSTEMERIRKLYLLESRLMDTAVSATPIAAGAPVSSSTMPLLQGGTDAGEQDMERISMLLQQGTTSDRFDTTAAFASDVGVSIQGFLRSYVSTGNPREVFKPVSAGSIPMAAEGQLVTPARQSRERQPFVQTLGSVISLNNNNNNSSSNTQSNQNNLNHSATMGQLPPLPGWSVFSPSPALGARSRSVLDSSSMSAVKPPPASASKPPPASSSSSSYYHHHHHHHSHHAHESPNVSSSLLSSSPRTGTTIQPSLPPPGSLLSSVARTTPSKPTDLSVENLSPNPPESLTSDPSYGPGFSSVHKRPLISALSPMKSDKPLRKIIPN